MTLWHILLLSAAFNILTFNASHGERIINGRKAQKNSLQYMASVQHNGWHICGGFLITPNYVLTAAHCYKSDLSVVLGTHNINPNKNPRKYAVERIIKHNLYHSVFSGYDIMLLKLSENVNVNQDVKSIGLSGSPVKPGSKCQVAGWGKTETQNTVNDLLVTDVSTVNTAVCKTLKGNLPPDVLCAGGYNTKSGTCDRDSGGPLVCNGLAVGIVSYGPADCKFPSSPDVYTEISAYRDWIEKVIKGDA